MGRTRWEWVEQGERLYIYIYRRGRPSPTFPPYVYPIHPALPSPYWGKVMKKTIQQQIIEELLAQGGVEVPCRSAKYRQFKMPYHSSGFYFIGKRGSVRRGNSISHSISYTPWLWGPQRKFDRESNNIINQKGEQHES